MVWVKSLIEPTDNIDYGTTEAEHRLPPPILKVLNWTSFWHSLNITPIRIG
jgi:hypothetical protein